jgi:1,3-beta-glucanosyltransferase GAS1
MSLYYELQNRNPQACDFSGNATVNNDAPASASAANSAASSCISNPSATFTPSSTGTPSTVSGSSGSSDESGDNGAVALFSDPKAMYGLASMVAVMIASGALILA